MGQNKAQKQAQERARKAAAQVATGADVQPAMKPNGKASEAHLATQPATPAQPSKQQQAIEKLKEGWAQKGVNLDKLTVKDDGKFKVLIVDTGWPTVRIGPSGGISVMELKSYASAFTAAMNGLELYERQKAREKKATAPVEKIAAAEKQTA